MAEGRGRGELPLGHWGAFRSGPGPCSKAAPQADHPQAQAVSAEKSLPEGLEPPWHPWRGPWGHWDLLQSSGGWLRSRSCLSSSFGRKLLMSTGGAPLSMGSPQGPDGATWGVSRGCGHLGGLSWTLGRLRGPAAGEPHAARWSPPAEACPGRSQPRQPGENDGERNQVLGGRGDPVGPEQNLALPWGLVLASSSSPPHSRPCPGPPLSFPVPLLETWPL